MGISRYSASLFSGEGAASPALHVGDDGQPGAKLGEVGGGLGVRLAAGHPHHQREHLELAQPGEMPV